MLLQAKPMGELGLGRPPRVYSSTTGPYLAARGLLGAQVYDSHWSHQPVLLADAY